MPRTTTPGFHTEATRTSGTEPILEAVELSVPFYAGVPNKVLRLVNDTDDLVISGTEYMASNFALQLPNDRDGEMPTAKLAFSALNSELVKLIETTHGGIGAKVRFIITRRSNPVIEFDMTMQFYNIVVTAANVVGDLGFKDLIATPSLNIRYEHRTAAGLY